MLRSFISRFRERPTHGGWPKVAAAAAPVTSLAWLALRKRGDPGADARWAILPALLWHQTEEWYWPGGFLEWFNLDVLGSREPLRPLTPRDGVIINVPIGWGTAVAAGGFGERVPALPITVFSMHALNGALHVGWALGRARYDPGTASSLLCFAPAAANGLARLLGDPDVTRRQKALGLAVGIGGSFALAFSMKRRVEREGLARPPRG